jgi:hypothetical protein
VISGLRRFSLGPLEPETVHAADLSTEQLQALLGWRPQVHPAVDVRPLLLAAASNRYPLGVPLDHVPAAPIPADKSEAA